MASGLRLPSYYIIAPVLVCLLSFYYIFNLKSINTGLTRDLKFYQETLVVTKDINKELVKDFQKKLDDKERRIRELDQENLAKHNALGSVQSNLHELQKDVREKSKEIRELYRLASSHKGEISNLKNSVSRSKDALAKLSDKAQHLMSNHTQLIKENLALSKRNDKLQNVVNQHQDQRSSTDKRIQELIRTNNLLNRNVEDLTRKNKAITESIKQKIKESYAARTRRSGAPQHVAGRIKERHVVNNKIYPTAVTPDGESLKENKKTLKRTASDDDSIDPDKGHGVSQERPTEISSEVITSEPSSQMEQQTTTTDSTSEENIVKREALERNDFVTRYNDEAEQRMDPTTEDTESMMQSFKEQANLDHP